MTGTSPRSVSCSARRSTWRATRCIVANATPRQSSSSASGTEPRRRRSAQTPSAKQLPYGQCALRTDLNHLQRAGHLRRGREMLAADSGSAHWITRRGSRVPHATTTGGPPSRGATYRKTLRPRPPARGRTPCHDQRTAHPGPPPGRAAPPPPDRQAPTATAHPIPAPPDPGVRGVQSARASGGPAGRRMQRLPGRIRAPTRPASLLPAPEIHARANEIRAAMSLKREEGTPV